MHLPTRSRGIRDGALLFILTLLVTLLLPVAANAQESERIVRVGWFESPFNLADSLGRRSGYAYDYQQKIAGYTGWKYEYVEGSWPDLLQMLVDGKIDLLSDVSYTDERAERMLYSSLPMGGEEYYLFASPGHQEFTPDDYATFNGKKIGVNKGSVQISYFNNWAKDNGVTAEIVELTGSEADNLKKLSQGDIDLYLSLDGFFDKGACVPVCRVGVSDFYFAVSKARPELLKELNNAMNRIQDENQYYDEQLYAKYLQTSSVNNFLSTNEKEWLNKHGAIRVGYQDNYLAFCAKDPETGELIGALRECLDVATSNIENADLQFEPVCYPSSADAMEAMENGEVDCVFPANLTPYDGEVLGAFITPSLIRTDMSAIIREADQKSFASKDRVTVAVNAGNPNYDMFLLDHFPDWRAIYFDDTQECLKAVAEGQADCLLISNYRYNNIASLCEKYRLTTWSTGVEMDYCFAVNREETVLYSILSKVTAIIPPSTTNASLVKYYTEDARVNTFDSFSQVLLGIVVCALAIAAIVVLVVLLRGAWSERKGGKGRHPDPTQKDFALFDDLPFSYSVYRVVNVEHSKLYDAEIIYANHEYARLGGLPLEAVVGRRVRELYPYVGEEWHEAVRRAAVDGEPQEFDFNDSLSGRTFRFSAQQVVCPGYCAVTYLEKVHSIREKSQKTS